MVRKSVDCIDCGTEYCPCKLAESGECLICSQCQNKSFCDCLNWKGVCVYQELYNNNNKAKEGRKTFKCNVNKIIKFNDELMILQFKVPHKLALDLKKPGSYVFIKTDVNNYFDIPISVMNSDIEKDVVSVMVEIKGIKTNKLKDIKKQDNILIRGPYWNGVFGIKEIERQKENKVLLLCRGIGIAPMMPVLKRLASLENESKVIIDKSSLEEKTVNFIINQYKIRNVTYSITTLLEKGKLSDFGKAAIKKALDNDVNYIHIAGADILTYEVISYLHEIERDDVCLSCCNNFKMCCGEGICGACTIRFAGHKVRRFCKEQTDPRSIFEGRRLI